MTPRTIQKRITSMQKIGLIKRDERRHSKFGSQTNLYRFDGLIADCTPHALEKIAAAKKAAEVRRDGHLILHPWRHVQSFSQQAKILYVAGVEG